jgi:hypothetical protein
MQGMCVCCCGVVDALYGEVHGTYRRYVDTKSEQHTRAQRTQIHSMAVTYAIIRQ